VSHNSDRLVRFDSQIKVSEDSLLSGWVPEPDILELDASLRDLFYSSLLWIDL